MMSSVVFVVFSLRQFLTVFSSPFDISLGQNLMTPNSPFWWLMWWWRLNMRDTSGAMVTLQFPVFIRMWNTLITLFARLAFFFRAMNMGTSWASMAFQMSVMVSMMNSLHTFWTSLAFQFRAASVVWWLMSANLLTNGLPNFWDWWRF